MVLAIHIILLPFRVILGVPYYLGLLAEWIEDKVLSEIQWFLEGFIVYILKWNDIAKKQAKTKPSKFGKPMKVYTPTIKVK